jgi:DNA-binding Xre family transcriptional regulator
MKQQRGHCGGTPPPGFDEFIGLTTNDSVLWYPITATQKDIPLNFKEWRKLRDLTLKEVETKTGISNAYLSQLETGKITKPSFEVVVKLCECYNVILTIK